LESAFYKTVILLQDNGHELKGLVFCHIVLILIANAVILATYFYGLLRIRQMYNSVQINLQLKKGVFHLNTVLIAG